MRKGAPKNKVERRQERWILYRPVELFPIVGHEQGKVYRSTEQYHLCIDYIKSTLVSESSYSTRHSRLMNKATRGPIWCHRHRILAERLRGQLQRLLPRTHSFM